MRRPRRGPAVAASDLAAIHRLWIEDLGYQDLDGGIYWGRSDFAISRARDGDVRFSAALQPERTTITIAVDSGCFEDSGDDTWLEPVSPTA
ncbi:hypothetical protein GCM10027447_23750 [Glycomyces halotolerans]